MHVEPPAHAPQTLKDFAKHYLMIVLGILTAVGVEQGLEALHHHRLAAEATQQIDEELRSNLRESQRSLDENRKRLAALHATALALSADVSAGDTSPAKFSQRIGAITIGSATPTLRRDAWEAAIASQALSYVDAARVRRYSEGYSAQRDVTQAMLATFSLGNWPGRLQDSIVDAKLGHVDQAALLKALASYQLAIAAIAENEREMVEAFGAALGAGRAAH